MVVSIWSIELFSMELGDIRGKEREKEKWSSMQTSIMNTFEVSGVKLFNTNLWSRWVKHSHTKIFRGVKGRLNLFCLIELPFCFILLLCVDFYFILYFVIFHLSPIKKKPF